MKPKEIGKAYDQITDRWSDKNFNRQNGITQHKKAFSFVESRGKALDVGCGCTGRFIDLLIDEGFTPEGVDISTNMLNIARERHPNITFHHQDICNWTIPHTYDFITAWDSIWHIPLDQHRPVLTRLVSSLNQGGVLIFSFGGTEQAGGHSNSVMGPEVYYSSLGTNEFLQLFIDLNCICKHLEYDQHPELHTYLIVQKL